MGLEVSAGLGEGHACGSLWLPDLERGSGRQVGSGPRRTGRHSADWVVEDNQDRVDGGDKTSDRISEGQGGRAAAGGGRRGHAETPAAGGGGCRRRMEMEDEGRINGPSGP